MSVELFGRALRGEATETVVRTSSGALVPLPLRRWLGDADAADESVLARALAPVLDVGCGPGRHVAALAARGVHAVGLDVSREAVRLARRRGARAIHGSVFADVAGAWRTVLLLDGNVGIGGSPALLLRRVASLLAPDGRVLIELDPPRGARETLRLRLESGERAGAWFEWGRTPADAVEEVAAAAGLRVTEAWCCNGRHFASVAR
jgi:SAM-dependent methyltransferase